MDDLKPCPFCGGRTEEDSYITNKHMTYGEGWIGCRCCRVFMNYTHGNVGRELAIKAWNRRVFEPLVNVSEEVRRVKNAD